MSGRRGNIGGVEFEVGQDISIRRLKVHVMGAPVMRVHTGREEIEIIPDLVTIRQEGRVLQVGVHGMIRPSCRIRAGETYDVERIKSAPRWIQELIIGLGVAI